MDRFDHDFFRTSGVENFKLSGFMDFPEHYPSEITEDTYTVLPREMSFEERKKLYIRYVRNNPGVDSVKGIFFDILRIAENITPVHYKGLYAAVHYVNSRMDCADFALNGLMRLYRQLFNHPLFKDGLRREIELSILNFKYWPDEPGIDSMCYWTENHYIIFSTAEYLAGYWFPERVFRNSGQIGEFKYLRAKRRVLKWLDLKLKTGFNEWLSNVYYDEDFLALLNLYDFAPDEEIKVKAKSVLDIMVFDMAINSYKGLFSCTHGRTYTHEKLHPMDESTIDVSKLLFGMGRFANKDSMGAVMFSLSSYRVPVVIYEIARDNSEEWINRQRVSIRLDQKRKWGLGRISEENALLLLSFGGYSHPHTFNHLAFVMDKFNWWENKFFQEFKSFKKIIQIGKYLGLTNLVAKIMEKDMSRNSFEESHIYTYRTPDYMLSTSQNYRPSVGGDQHHIWQATLDSSCVVFTTHPGGYGETAPDAYFHGNGFLPASFQYKSINITIYKTPKVIPIVIKEILEITHAFFPKERFNEVVEKQGWVFGRSNSGYIAIYSRNGYRWSAAGEYKDMELIADGRENIWVTELGRESTHGSFSQFIETVSSQSLSFNKLSVSYQSDYCGLIEVGWKKPLKVDGEVVRVNNYPRYDNPACYSSFPGDHLTLDYRGQKYTIY